MISSLVEQLVLAVELVTCCYPEVIISKCHPEQSEGSKVPGNMVLTPMAMV